MLKLKSGMREDCLDKDVLDEAKEDANVDIFNMKRVFSPLSDMPTAKVLARIVSHNTEE